MGSFRTCQREGERFIESHVWSRRILSAQFFSAIRIENVVNVIVFGGDGFCGWPTSLRLSQNGYDVTIIDSLSHRRIDLELGVQSLTPIASLETRLAAWRRLTGKTIGFRNVDLAQDYDGLRAALAELKPDAVVHFAEQRSAPYSMRDAAHKRYTIDNNINATHNLLVALVDLDVDVHLVHLGTMGV